MSTVSFIIESRTEELGTEIYAGIRNVFTTCHHLNGMLQIINCHVRICMTIDLYNFSSHIHDSLPH